MKLLLNLPPITLGAYLIRILATGASVGDSLVIIGLSALYGWFLYTESKKETPVNKQYLDRLIDIEEQVKLNKETVNAFKLGNQLRR